MAESDERIRLQIAFEGGQVVGALVSAAGAEALAKALTEDKPVFDLETDDGTYLLALRKVVYVRRSLRETHIGFGATT